MQTDQPGAGRTRTAREPAGWGLLCAAPPYMPHTLLRNHNSAMNNRAPFVTSLCPPYPGPPHTPHHPNPHPTRYPPLYSLRGDALPHVHPTPPHPTPHLTHHPPLCTHCVAMRCRTSAAAAASMTLPSSATMVERTPAAPGDSSHSASSHSCEGSKSADLEPSRSRFSSRFHRNWPSCGRGWESTYGWVRVCSKVWAASALERLAVARSGVASKLAVLWKRWSAKRAEQG